MVRYDKSTAEKGARYVRDQRRLGGSGRRVGTGVAAGGGLIGIIVAIIAALTGGGGTSFNIDSPAFDQSAGPVSGGATTVVDPDAETVEYMKFLMFDIQDTWAKYFEQAGLSYTETQLNIFTGAVSTGCGQATSAVGPFYCPAPNDMSVYVDLDFYNELRTRFDAPGDFAQAYVIAHEVGHHVQNLTGISAKVSQAQQQDPGNRNEYSVRQELQADCLAGVWAYSASRRLTEDTGLPIIEQGDIAEGLAAAQSVGDDRIQAQAGMTVDPEEWTHGAAEWRERWFRNGFDNGDPEKCDTFAAAEL